jgi:hypothetical protein
VTRARIDDRLGDLVATEEEHVLRARQHPLADESPRDPQRKRAQPRLRHAIDPVVVALGQVPDLAGVRERRLEAGKLLWPVGERRRARGCTCFGLSSLLLDSIGRPRCVPADPGRDDRQQPRGRLCPGGVVEIVMVLAEVAVAREELVQRSQEFGAARGSTDRRPVEEGLVIAVRPRIVRRDRRRELRARRHQVGQRMQLEVHRLELVRLAASERERLDVMPGSHGEPYWSARSSSTW